MERLQPPAVVSLDQILPQEPLLMMGAGPVPIPHKVAYANSIVINHLGETMNRVIEQVKEMGRYVFQTRSQHVLGVAGPGSASMEMAICNLVNPGSRVLAVCNGLFSRRMAEMARRVGGEVVAMGVRTSEASGLAAVGGFRNGGKRELRPIVQGVRSNTVYTRHLQQFAEIANKYVCLLSPDAVCTLGTMPLDTDGW